MLDSARANEHVKHMVETKLCNSQCVKLDRHAGRPHCRSVSALQYITRQDLVSTDTRFNHHIKQNLIDYIVRTFFNRQYLQHIIAQKDRSHVHVSCVAAYLCSPRIYLTCKNLQDGSWQGNISDASLFAKFIVLQKQLQGPTTVAVTNKHTQEASTMSSNMRWYLVQDVYVWCSTCHSVSVGAAQVSDYWFVAHRCLYTQHVHHKTMRMYKQRMSGTLPQNRMILAIWCQINIQCWISWKIRELKAYTLLCVCTTQLQERYVLCFSPA